MSKPIELMIVEESGYDSAMEGMLFSFQKECPLDELPMIDFSKAKRVSELLAPKGKGHNKFLEHLHIEVIVRAGLDWWKHLDTYRVGVSKLSKSTMHTILKHDLEERGFFDDDVDPRILAIVEEYRQAGNLRAVSKNLPQGFLQTRKVTLSYKTLAEMIIQRDGHRLDDWALFIKEMRSQVAFPQYLPE